jgi:predicted kinase
MLVAMAGLPGSGKSTLAARLAAELGAVVLSKDEVRAALFPPPVRDYSAEQDDLCMDAVYRAAATIRRAFPERAVILDGRTFQRASQVRDLLDLAACLGEPVRLIECVCDDVVAQRRLEAGRAGHPAGNRTFDLYRALREGADPITVPRLVLDTGRLTPDECVRRCLAYLRGG